MRKRVLKILVFAWFVVTPLFWHLDLSKGNLGYYDTFSMAPYSVLHAAVFYALMLISFYVERYSLFNILLLTLYYPIILLTNYPYLTFRDVYLHSAPARTILADGKLNYIRNEQPEFWPSAFVLHALSTVVLGCDLVTANYILYIGLSVALALIMFSLAKTLENQGYALAWVCPILFLALFSGYEFLFHHYARSRYAFIPLFLFFLSFIRFKDRRGSLIQLLIIASLVTIHPFHSLYLVMFLFAFIAFNISNRSAYSPKRSLIALFSIVAFLGWFLFNASPHFEKGLQFIIKLAFSPEYIEPLLKAFQSHPGTSAVYFRAMHVPLWGLILRSYYKYCLLALILVAFFASMIIVGKRKKISEIPHIIASFISVSIVSLLFIFVLLCLPDWAFYRAATFAAFSSAFSSVISLNYIAKKKATLSKRAITLMILIFVMSLSLTTTILHFEKNQYYGELEHPSEFSSLSFLVAHIQRRVHITAYWKSVIYANYFFYNTTHYLQPYLSHQSLTLYVKEGNQTRLLSSLNGTINRSDFLIRGIRDRLLLEEPFLEESSEILAKLDEQLMTPVFNDIYSNGYYSIYSRTS